MLRTMCARAHARAYMSQPEVNSDIISQELFSMVFLTVSNCSWGSPNMTDWVASNQCEGRKT